MDGDDIAKPAAPQIRRRMTVTEVSVPTLPRGARMRFDERKAEVSAQPA